MPLLHPGEETAFPEPGRRFERHHHSRPYAALVIRGECDEVGDRGRVAAGVANVLVHASFDGHADAIGRKGAVFINFALDAPFDAPFGSVADVDAIVRAHRRDPVEASAILHEQFRAVETELRDWPDLLAAELASGVRLRIDRWAEQHGLHPVSVSRGFSRAYGVSPKRYRLERIASRAARRIRSSRCSLSAIAADCGFADQAHMTRALVGLFGITPAALRTLS